MSHTIPSLPDGLRIYAIGDVHGRLDLLEDMAEKIRADLEASPAERVLPNARPMERATEIFVGDYIDRGPRSRDVIDWLIDTPPLGDERICLLGNHEAMLLDVLADPAMLPHWLMNGGEATLASYGIASLPSSPAAQLAAMLEAIPPRNRDFLESLPRTVEFGTYLFVHAGIDPRRPLGDQDPEALIWIRDPFLRSSVDFGRIVVHGHTPVVEPDVRENRINIDTGAVFTGRLTCAVLEGAERRLLQTPPE